MRSSIWLGFIFLATWLGGQTYSFPVFKDTRIINTHSVEVLPKHKMDIRIAHRFGDIAGPAGGFQTLFGLENASDVVIGGEYGATNHLTLGVYRAKGAGVTVQGTAGLRQLLNGVTKLAIVKQGNEENSSNSPFSMTLLGVVTLSTTKRNPESPDALQSFPKFSHRLVYHGQLLLARAYSDRFSMQIAPGYTYRNLTPFEDQNGIFSLAVAGKIQLSKVYGLILDSNFPIAAGRGANSGYYPAIGAGLEIDTGGHVFQINLTNATGIMEADYIPYTTSNWLDGEFRMGFTVRRWFNL